MFDWQTGPVAATTDQRGEATGDEQTESLDRAKASRLSAWMIEQHAAGDVAQAKADPDGETAEAPVATEVGAGEALPEPVRAKMETSFGADFSSVRLHRDGSAGEAGAQAYATGDRIHVAPGLDPNSRSGQELIGHELTHVVQQRAGRVSSNPQGKGGGFNADPGLEAEADRAGARAARGERVDIAGGGATAAPAEAAQAKLAGTKAAMRAEGGKGGRHGSSWEKVVSKVGDYESLEARLLEAQRLRPKDKQKLLAELSKVERVAVAYLTDGKHKRAADDAFKRHTREQQSHGKKQKKQEQILRRWGAIKLLIPRVRMERTDIKSGKFTGDSGYSDKTRTGGKDNAVGGQLNRLDIVEYGDDTTFFKEDKSLDSEGGTAGHIMGIDTRDMNYGGRSVAMSRLDELFGGGVTARTSFGTHASKTDTKDQDLAKPKAKLGTVQQAAEGSTAKDLYHKGKISTSSDDKAQTGAKGNVSIDDPVLQRQLNIMQIIDVVAGQLDRHTGNFLLKVDANGQVQKVTGIDLDMSFGSRHDDISREQAPNNAHYKGMPVLIDKTFGEKLLTVSDDQVQAVLEPLLEQGEVAAAMSRWRQVKAKVAQAQREGKLVSDWNKATARQQIDSKTSYLGMTRAATLNSSLRSELEPIKAGDSTPMIWDFVGGKILRAAESNPDFTPEHGTHIVNSMFVHMQTDEMWQVVEATFQRNTPMQPSELDAIQQREKAAMMANMEGKITDAAYYEIRDEKVAAAQRMQPWFEPYRKLKQEWLTAMVEKFIAHFTGNPKATSLPAPPRGPAVPVEWIGK